jgi:hypothetical protein
MKKLYRFESFRGKMVLIDFEVIRETEHYYFIKDNVYKGRKVSKTSGAKNYAYTDKDEALKQFFYRKRKQVELLEKYLISAKNQKEESFEKLKEKNITVQFDKPIRIINYFPFDY